MFELPRSPRSDIEQVTFEHGGETHSVLDALLGDFTDGVVVIKDGEVVYERYFDGFEEHDHHLWASSTKSLTSLAAGILHSQGRLDLDAMVTDYLPILAESGFAGLTVQQVLNMVSALDYSEAYGDLVPGSVHFDYFRRIGLVADFELQMIDPTESDQPRGIKPFIPQLQRNAGLEPGTTFEYHSPNVDVIGWIIEQESGMPLHDFVRENIWAKLGAEHDAFMWTDADFSPVATGGMNTTLRDFARVGLAVLHDGRIGGSRVFPEDWVRAIPEVTDEQILHTDRSVYKQDGPSFDQHLVAYKNFWWIHDREAGIFSARGVFGQVLYVNRAANVVIAAFGSAPSASNAQRETFKIRLSAFDAIADHL